MVGDFNHHREFIAFETRFQMCYQCFLLVIFMTNDDEFQDIARNGMGTADTNAVFHRGKCQCCRLNLGGINLISAHIDDVIAPTLQPQASLFINPSNVGRLDNSIGHHCLCGHIIMPIARHQRITCTSYVPICSDKEG